MIPFYEYKTWPYQISSCTSLDYPLHFHLDPEILYVRTGRMEIQVEEEVYQAGEGDLAVIFPNTAHAYRTLTAPYQTDVALIICNISFLDEPPKDGRPTSPILSAGELHPDVPYAISSLLKEAENEDQAAIRLFFRLLWLRIQPLLTLVPDAGQLSPALAAPVLSYIAAHFCEPLTLDMLAKEFGVSRFHLSRLFSQTIHTGFCEYVNSLRINHAKKLLGDTSQSVLEIAFSCGFESQQTFNRVFKQFCGLTPREYRKRWQSPIAQ